MTTRTDRRADRALTKAVQREEGKAEISRTPLAALAFFLTPTELHYVRDHLTEPPRLDPVDWRLQVSGLVRTPLELGLADLERLPAAELAVTLECAGNGGANGVIGGVGCVSTALWRGPRLVDVLTLAGVEPGAREVVATGGDRGQDPDDPLAEGRYARALPLEKATHPDTLVALWMNGERLPRRHGFPARLIVPGWYGMDSVKWIASVRVSGEPFSGFYAAHRYRERRGADGLDTGRPVRQLRVKALIAHPRPTDTLRAGIPCQIVGAAWSGEEALRDVRVSVDGGRTWEPAVLAREQGRYAWRQWSFEWTPARPGTAVLLARATNAAGRSQPLRRLSARVYEANWVQPVRVRVTD